MKAKAEDLAHQLADKGLKVTPQRMSILEAVHHLNNHPTAENIITEIYQVFDNAQGINDTIIEVVNSLDDDSFTTKGGCAAITEKTDQLNNMFFDYKLQQSLTKLIELENAIDQMIADDETKYLLMQRTGEIRAIPGIRI